MILDLSHVETLLLQALGAVLLAIAIAGGKLMLTKLDIQISDAKKAELEDVASKSLAAGISGAQTIIAAKGWDHVAVKNAVVAEAIDYAVRKFPDTLIRSDVNPAAAAEAADKLGGIMSRKYPEAVSLAAASPATPPVRPPSPVAAFPSQGKTTP